MNHHKYEYDVNEVVPGLWLGNLKAVSSEGLLKMHNIKTVFSVMDKHYLVPKYNGINYYVLPIDDNETCGRKIDDVIDACVTNIHRLLKNTNVLVHCKNGHHRSAVIIGCYLMKYWKMDYETVVKYINMVRPYALRRHTCMSEWLFQYWNMLCRKICDNNEWVDKDGYVFMRCV